MLNKIGILLGSSLFMSNLLATPTHPSAVLEPLQSVQFFEQYLNIKVNSNGCTKPNHFVIKTQQHTGAVQLSIKRQQADRCRAMPRIVEIKLSFKASANTHYYIANPWIFSQASPVSTQDSSVKPADKNRLTDDISIQPSSNSSNSVPVSKPTADG